MEKLFRLVALLILLAFTSVVTTASLTGCVVKRDKGFDEAD